MNADHPLLVEIRGFLEKQAIRDRQIIVAVSGGPDSMALLHALRLVSSNFGLSLTAAHLDHQLRGKESDLDETFVAEHCRTRGINYRFERANVRQRAEESAENLEATARRVRYEWLAGVAAEAKATFVATGHTADDQAETVLHHLIRGTGLRGLRGIARRRFLTPSVEVIRPLLRVNRGAVRSFLESEGISARQDQSNTDLRFTRNRIRHELLPTIRQHLNPDINAALQRLAEQASELFRVQEKQALQVLGETERPRAGTVVILDADRLRHANRETVREVFHQIWEREAWPLGEMSFEHWERLGDLVSAGSGAHDFPGGIHARRKAHVLQLHPCP